MTTSSYEGELRQYLGARADMPLLSPAAELRLARRARAGCSKSRDELVKRNMKLVVRTARKFIGQGLSFEDLLQEGSLGLLKAADRFDPELGYKFGTYATWWVHQSVANAVQSRGRTIKLPKHVGETRRRVYTAEKEFAARHGRDPLVAEICENGGISAEEYERAMVVPEASKSLDAALVSDEPGSATLGTMIADPSQGNELSGVEPSLLQRVEISRALRVLNDRQRWVICRRYGLDGGAPVTQAELGEQMGVSYQRAAVIEREARERLRAALRSRAMEPAGYQEAG